MITAVAATITVIFLIVLSGLGHEWRIVDGLILYFVIWILVKLNNKDNEKS